MALLYMHLSETLFNDDENKKQQYLKIALKVLEHCQHVLRGKRMTFICGDPGETVTVNPHTPPPHPCMEHKPQSKTNLE